MLRYATIEHFGWTKTDNRRVVLIKIANNNGLAIELINYGATLKALFVPDRCAVPRNVILGFETLSGCA
jgi:aldose 1-epimerase